MYVRFVVNQRDQRSGQEMGLFAAMSELHENGVLFDYEEELEKEIYQWFKKNLLIPKVQSSESNHYSKPGAISWFKHTAREHIEKMRAYSQILEAHDVAVAQLTTMRPGQVLYEDEHQIAAVPFRDTFAQ